MAVHSIVDIDIVRSRKEKLRLVDEFDDFMTIICFFLSMKLHNRESSKC